MAMKKHVDGYIRSFGEISQKLTALIVTKPHSSGTSNLDVTSGPVLFTVSCGAGGLVRDTRFGGT